MALEHISGHKTLARMVDALQANGRYTFDRKEARANLQTSEVNLKRAVMRLASKDRIVVPIRGFYVIVPLEYRVVGSPPASWFVDDVMKHLGLPYYVGVLSAASIHGAAHQQPQEYQIVTDVARRQIVAGRVRLRFLGKKELGRTLTMPVRTETGSMQVSTPEATALDLLRYASTAAGGLGNVATVLSELAEEVGPQRLVNAVRADGKLALAQRLGYLLELVGAAEQAAELGKMLAGEGVRNTPLRPGRPIRGCPVDHRWGVIINETIEVDL
jgi:predicted transcriptional regulator of viral defense system